ncbi:MAG TPA: type II secretion system F family protein [Candidatus Thermoplasmatota archaeon]|nr:type II secretion system F family protein [Candidatus Thermoplasmatota archaeon]
MRLLPTASALTRATSNAPVVALAVAAIVAAIAGGVSSLFPPGPIQGLSVYFLSFATLLIMAAGYAQGAAPQTYDFTAESPTGRFEREIKLHGYGVVTALAFFFTLLFEVLAVLAAVGLFRLFGPFATAFISYYPALLSLFLLLLAAGPLVVRRNPSEIGLTKRRRSMGYLGLATTGLFVLITLMTASGLFDGAGLNGVRSERAAFVLTASSVSLFFFVKSWLRIPDFKDVSTWMESEDRFGRSGLPQILVFGLVGIAGLLILLSPLSAFGVLPPEAAIFGLGISTLLLLGAVNSLSTRYVREDLEADFENVHSLQERRHLILRGTSILLAFLGTALGLITFLAVLAQVAGLSLFGFLLGFFVANYPIILTLALIPPAAACIVRLYVKTDVPYDDNRKTVTMLASAFAMVLVFFGVFIGSGLAKGQGIALENAVLTMSFGVVAAYVGVANRGLYPSVLSLIKDSVQKSQDASEDTKENIRRNMMITYLGGLAFVLLTVGFNVAVSLNVVEVPEGIATDLFFFVYLLGGLALITVIGVRYYQGVNIDPRSLPQDKNEERWKRRLTASEINRLVVLGVSITSATIMAVIGVLITAGIVTSLGGIPLETRHSTDFFVFAILLGLGPYGYYHAKEVQRVKAIDNKFPEFLRDLAESQRSGMTLTQAVITAAKGNYGALTPEIRKMAAQIEWGVSFTDALTRFSRRVRTPLIERTVTLIVEAANSGGNVVDVLSAAADDSREIQMILKDRKGSMNIYMMIIYVAFLVFMGVVAILTKQFIPEVAKAVSSAAANGPVNVGGMTFSTVDEQAFKTLFFHAAVIQGFGGGLVAGVMQEGKPVAGLRHAFIMVIMAYVVFRFLIGA